MALTTTDIYTKEDYRDLLYEWFWAAKELNPKLSFRNISKKLELKSPNHFHLVISKKRHLSQEKYLKSLDLMNLDRQQHHYAKLLFRLNREPEGGLKDDLIKQISLLREQSQSSATTEKQHRLVGHQLAWYIKMGAMMFEGLSPADVTKKVISASPFSITPEQVAAAIEQLHELKFIKILNDQCYFDKTMIRTKWDFESRDIKAHHRNNLGLAQQAIPWPIDKRFFGSVTIPLNGAIRDEMISDIRSLLAKYLDRSNCDITDASDCSKVMTLQCALYPFFEFDTDPST